jgi:6-phosphogluconate dehydrogenase
MDKRLTIIGLGKMGKGLAEQLLEKDWEVYGINRSQDIVEELASRGLKPLQTIDDIIAQVPSPRVIWLMLPAGAVVDEYLFGNGSAENPGLVNKLSAGDMIIDGGNSYFEETKQRGEKVEAAGTGVKFMDVGVSGGPGGARNGACLMIGGSADAFNYCKEVFEAVSINGSFAHFEGIGAGHFVKMVHNGIEYGMMQAIGEGFAVMKESDYGLDLEEVARIYQAGSVIESRLVGWTGQAFKDWGVDLENISGEVSASGEGLWTVQTAKKMGIPTPVIEESLKFRDQSKGNPSYTGKVVSAQRGQFGGHPVFIDGDKK